MASRWDPKSKITPHLSLLALNKTLTLVYFNIKRLNFKEIDFWTTILTKSSLGAGKFTRI